MIFGIIAGIFCGLTLLALLAGFIYLASFVAWPNKITLEDEIKYEKEHGMWKNYDELPKEEYIVKSFDGYELNSVFVPAANPSDKYVIISHGYSGCRLGSVKYLHMFRDMGFNCFIYDDRGHGSNKKHPCTMGYLESQDLMCVIGHIYSRFGEDIILGLHGESMGSGLSNNAIMYSPKVKFIVSDCGYSDLEKLLADLVVRRIHIPGFFAKPAGIASKILYGYNFSAVKPIERLRTNEIPMCFIHGEADDFIPCEHAKEMYEANKGYKELHLIPEAGHAYSIVKDEAAYRKIVAAFLTNIGILQ